MKKILLLLALLLTIVSAERIYATFNVVAYKRADLAFSTGGTVREISADIAMLIKKDAVLATLNNDDLKAKLEIARIAVAHAKADYERQLLAKSVIQKSKLDLYKFQYDNAKAQLVYTQSLLDKTILKAPFDGVITDRKIDIGDVVSGMAPRTAFTIQSEHKRKLILEFDQKYWSSVTTGNTFEYRIDGDSQLRHGKIIKIYPKANAKTRKMVAEVYADDLIVGLFGTGYIVTQDEGEK
jgi:RND family efflux transporter MFP subunit